MVKTRWWTFTDVYEFCHWQLFLVCSTFPLSTVNYIYSYTRWQDRTVRHMSYAKITLRWKYGRKYRTRKVLAGIRYEGDVLSRSQVAHIRRLSIRNNDVSNGVNTQC